jgi:hypothetical protein
MYRAIGLKFYVPFSTHMYVCMFVCLFVCFVCLFVLFADEELMSALHKSHILRSSSICKYSKKKLFCFDHSISSMESCLLFFVFRDGALTH